MSLRPKPSAALSLTALRAFEAAARLGGFRAAADELGVTAAAVSGQVKGLEARLGHALFVREARGIRLTEAGALALPDVTVAFDALAQAETTLWRDAPGRVIRVAALPAVAQLWLPARLAGLGRGVSVVALEIPPEGKRQRFDVTAFYGPGGTDVLVPVAAPDVTGPRLSDSAWARDWAVWAKATGQGVPEAGATFSLYSMVVEAAVRGAGVAMGRMALVAPLLADGRLVEVGPRVPLDEGIVVRARPGGAALAAALEGGKARV